MVEVDEDNDWNPPFKRLLAARLKFGVSTMAGEGPLPSTRPLPPLIVGLPRSGNKQNEVNDYTTFERERERE